MSNNVNLCYSCSMSLVSRCAEVASFLPICDSDIAMSKTSSLAMKGTVLHDIILFIVKKLYQLMQLRSQST